MKTVILAGGRGSRLADETGLRPKPMVEVGGQPILWHILKHYASFGFDEFVIALGYKGDVIRRYFWELTMLADDMSVDLKQSKLLPRANSREPWLVHLKETGDQVNTGGRLLPLRSLLQDDTFMLTYGDGVSNVDIRALLAFHKAHGKMATLTAVRPTARFGALTMKDDNVVEFAEKLQTAEGWINGGFFVLEPKILDYIDGDDASFESDALVRLAREGQLKAFRHEDFWFGMDTPRDLRTLEALWESGNPPWRTWK
jgi:glucose-1-phosphate cytidylyltransferase